MNMKLLVIFGFGLFPAFAQAYPVLDVTCREGGCFNRGWTVTTYNVGETSLVECLAGGCEFHGWTEQARLGGDERITNCDAGGCFDFGWSTRILRTGQYLGRTTCLEGPQGTRGCLSAGWVSEQYPYSTRIIAECVDGDCAQHGWRTAIPGRGWQTAICKPGGCFERGWTVHQ